MKIKAERSEERPKRGLKVKEEAEEVDLEENVEREKNSNQLRPKNQQKQPLLDLVANLIIQ